MQSKRYTYTLIAVLASIWIIAGYKIYTAVHKNEDSYNSYNIGPTKVLDKVTDTFSLSLDFQDPFLLQNAHENSITTAGTMTKKVHSEQPQVPSLTLKPAGVFFKGVISNFTGKRKVAVISVNGQDITLSEHESSSNISLIKIYGDDSIRIRQEEHEFNITK